MKKLVMIACLLTVGLVTAQDGKPLYEKDGDLVKVTFFHEDGSVKQQGFYKNKLLTGAWVTFDKKGNKTAIAHYENGKKVGKWFMWHKDGLKEINYENHTIASVQTWKEDTKIAVK
ncbi:nicotinic acid mononucleotide adenyltransferase [Tenacibaculum sp. IB213877]|uniref:toxin-antitoxin system YwqK family antitoxin n=1 Tax=Tenacibaculum sp. IB213877 TaxID=3097351 RepID=UPI002A59FB4A|nr:nicotinic acid mononucleotide adenyltransferase [Tenacibaculum sp. IB213877]MDY0781281.1 nicotinic acid mononucleotide adenyltransferase [Tenacibaculum sp. IB213877]